jgi:hypothetical protein
MIATASQVIPILALVAAIVAIAGASAVVIVCWDKAPWWRTFIKPSRELRNDREQVKRWKLRKRFPRAFGEGGPK